MLRRTADDTDPVERLVVANAEQLVIVTAVADPVPRPGSSTAAWSRRTRAASTPVLCLTKADLGDPEPFAAQYRELEFPRRRHRATTGRPTSSRGCSTGGSRALVGHSGVGKSTLVNRLLPDAARATGIVSAVGKGRHTTVAAIALPLPDGRGWVIDTPGVRSFGLAHVTPDAVPAAFDDLAAAIEDCPRGCGHLGPPADPECALDVLVAEGKLRPARLAALRRVFVALA